MEHIQPFEMRKVRKIVETKETEALLECINSLEIHAESIGEGGNAEVFAIEGGQFSKVCLKRIKEKQQLICNSIDEENKFQGKAREAGVRTPLALISIDTDKGSFLIMERVDGCTVEQAIQDPSQLPENFSYQIFANDLDDQILKMHNAGIYHRDLHVRNVMINNQGMPVIIDFGTATEGTGSDFTYEQLATVYNQKTGKYDQVSGVFKDDLQMVRSLKSALRPTGLRHSIDKK